MVTCRQWLATPCIEGACLRAAYGEESMVAEYVFVHARIVHTRIREGPCTLLETAQAEALLAIRG